MSLVRPFGRLVAEDARDKLFPMRAALVPAPSRSRFHKSGGFIDQGKFGICVAAAWKGWLTGSPLMTRDGLTPEELYRLFILADEFPENDLDIVAMQFGTSVRAGAKVLASMGHVLEYRWAENADDAVDWIVSRSGIVTGFNWKTGMMETDSDGYIHPTGRDEGGHSTYFSGYSFGRDALRGRNTWAGFGWKGWFWLKREDFAQLLAEDGEACAAIERKVVRGV